MQTGVLKRKCNFDCRQKNSLKFYDYFGLLDVYLRYLKAQIERDLSQKMVFIAGPRQIGKTTLAKSVISDPMLYLNWDASNHRDIILREKWPAGDAIIFDEIHKYRRWRNLLKGSQDYVSGEGIRVAPALILLKTLT